MSQAVITLLSRILTQLSTIGTPSNIAGITRVAAFSTTTPLAGAGVYTSPTVDGVNYKLLTFLALTDQAGSFFIQHSDDGTNWTNSAAAASATTANTPSLQSVTITLRYIRIVYTNGATLQGTFKLTGYLSPL